MAPKTVIGIDLDGTVLDCRPRQEAVLMHLVPEAKPHAEILWSFKRAGLSTKAALEKLGLVLSPDFSEAWTDLIEAPQYLTYDRDFPDATAALGVFSQVGDLYLITSRQYPDGVYATLERLKLTSYFKEIIIVPVGVEAAVHKAKQLIKCGATMHFGDTEVDGKAASHAGIPFWAVTCGQRSKDFLERETDAAFLSRSLYAAHLLYMSS